MKKSAFILLLLAACGGNYSNEDVEFLSALPARHDLESKLPQQTTQSALQGTRQDAISVGQPSQAYLDTKNASDAFNNGLFSLLQLIDDIRKIPPSIREPDRRVWGPFPNNDAPDFLVQVVMERQQLVLFNWRIEMKRKNAPASAPWIEFVKGSFHATGGVRKGSGEVHLLAKAARDAGLPTPNLDALDTLDVGYVTDKWPIEVNMFFVFVPNPSSSILAYGYREYEDHRGSMGFIVAAADLSFVLGVTSQWLPSGQGRADAVMVVGYLFGATGVECWDAQFWVTYANKPWETPTLVGDPGSCAF